MNPYQVLLEIIKPDGVFSEKRALRVFVYFSLMVLTFIDYFLNHQIRTEIWAGWFSLLGYDGWRITKEKKDVLTANKSDKPKDQNPDEK